MTTLADDLHRLDELRSRGALSDDEFARAKARLLDSPAAIPAVEAINRLRRSRAERWIGGVCGGIAVSTQVEAWIWRLVFTGLALFGGTGVVLYLLLWIFVPEES